MAETRGKKKKNRPLALKGLIFDCDGVLLNSRAANIAFYNNLRSLASLPPLNAEEEEYVHMATYEQALERVFQGAAAGRAAEFLDKLETYFDYYSLLHVEKGLLPMLDWLRAMNIRLAICTNRLSPLEGLLARFGLDKYFSPLQTASNSCPKPSPDGLLKTLAAWGIQPGESAYIGDSKVDEMAAAAAGVPFWSFNNQELEAGLHFNDFAELHGWLRIAAGEKNLGEI